MPEEDTFNKLAEFFKILGDTTRVKILFAFRSKWNVCMWYCKCIKNE